MLTDRGRYALALGGACYVAAWGFGSLPLYPLAVGLVLAVAAAWVWIRLVGRPLALRRRLPSGAHVAGSDVHVVLELELGGRLKPGSLLVVERVDGLLEREVVLRRKAGALRGEYVIENAPRGRYRFEPTEVVLEDPFGLDRVERRIETSGALVVRPRLVELERLFSETGLRLHEGRRLLLRRPSGFDLHSVREYEQGESLRHVHWPSTARRGQLMVKDLEDSPRDEVLVLLDADASFAVGTAPTSSFEVAVSAAGSILKAHAGRGRRAGLVVNGRETSYQAVQTLEGDWELALDLLAAVQPDGHRPLSALLADGAGLSARASELCVVTSGLSARLADRLLRRSATRRGTSLVYVDSASFAADAAPNAPLAVEARVQLTRLDQAGIPVCVVRRGDELAARLGPQASAAVSLAGTAR